MAFSKYLPVVIRRNLKGGNPNLKFKGIKIGIPSFVNRSAKRCDKKPIINDHHTAIISTIKILLIELRNKRDRKPKSRIPTIE